MDIMTMGCDIRARFPKWGWRDSHTSASIRDPRYRDLLSPSYPTAPLSSSAAQAGGRKMKNAPSVSSQDSPLAKERKDMTQ
ncbi:hypothetical protein I79_024094 [Cricetulus griseus]|uniref:Uncharacterized protein n=1 Tax=Cricetulus griseus TaxID=10029 RepID=G3IJQ8_CRIGR|nr:hypothetical protein I79_024094 [Cricetulus griseus]